MTKLEQLQLAIDEGLASPPSSLSIEEIINQGFSRLNLMLLVVPTPDLKNNEELSDCGKQVFI
jgi:hypothetical protein